MNKDIETIIKGAIRDSMPNSAVLDALDSISFPSGRLITVSVGKAAYEMASAAYERLGKRIDKGIIITKYGHIKGSVGDFECYEAGHPIPDGNGYKATSRVLELTSGLCENDSVLFLLSGGGSALFEKPLVSEERMASITNQLLKCGADIVEINTLRKRFSGVKGGKFALSCMPAHVYTIVLSDIIGDPLDMIASGPAYPDSTCSKQALEIAEKYGLRLSAEETALLAIETPKVLTNTTTYVTGSVGKLCASAERICKELGYKTVFLTSSLCCEASEAGSFLASVAADHQNTTESLAFIAGGETVVHVNGNGKGGRNQELVLASSLGIRSCRNTVVFSIGSDGTDGPTDAAGGVADENTAKEIEKTGISVSQALKDNDSYNALKAVDSLVFTGSTGTNVNDLSVVLIKR